MARKKDHEPAAIGDNSSAAAGQLKAFIERVERLEEEKKQIGEDIREVFAEAKSNGFNVKVMRRIVGLRKKDADTRREEEEMLQLYMQQLGMEF